MSKIIYRPGDRVRILHPHVFVRCGYPFDMMTETDRILEKHDGDIRALVDKIDPANSHYGKEGDMRAVASRLARILAVRRGYDGNVRRIYTEFDANILGQEATVYAKRFVKTGERAFRFWGEAFLADEQTHVILKVYGPRTMFEIEAKNVEKLP